MLHIHNLPERTVRMAWVNLGNMSCKKLLSWLYKQIVFRKNVKLLNSVKILSESKLKLRLKGHFNFKDTSKSVKIKLSQKMVKIV